MEDSNTVVESTPSDENLKLGNVPISLDIEIDDDDTCNVDGKDLDEPATLKKRRRMSSTVWGFYKMLPLPSDGKQRCKCRKCRAIYQCDIKFGTSNLRRHLQNCKKRDIRDIGQLILQSNASSSISMSDSRFDINEFRELFTACIIVHDLFFQCVEWVGLRALLHYLRCDLQIISRNIARSDCKKLFIKEKGIIQK
ncbi:uncharacterized protein LOC114579711 [Dendrobium catenatum]|uniref:uncharacterized protein LOC114579711 n=1 Tax=Dendrobium catenatum TaxID=906689 RepID=UPI00109EED91|nr:uncharacterized protein LOC114579711 [Dendrobium catenatum]XP_028551018.1 uncharacterized protein LOC114579711 [Dendrobium catenatum]